MSIHGLLIILISSESMAKCIDIDQPKETYFTLKPKPHISLSEKKKLKVTDYVYFRAKSSGLMTNPERFNTGIVFVFTHFL